MLDITRYDVFTRENAELRSRLKDLQAQLDEANARLALAEDIIDDCTHPSKKGKKWF